MDDQQLIKTICPKCGKYPIMGMFHTIWVCGECLVKLAKLEQEKNTNWIQEVDFHDSK